MFLVLVLPLGQAYALGSLPVGSVCILSHLLAQQDFLGDYTN